MVFFGDPYVVLTHPGLQVELPPLLVTAAPPLRQVDTSTNVFLGPVSQTHPTVLIVILCLSVGLLLLLLFKKKKEKKLVPLGLSRRRTALFSSPAERD